MKLYKFILLFFIILFGFSNTSYAQVPYFIWEGTYALDPHTTKNEDQQTGHRIATYLPPGTLLFDVKTLPHSVTGVIQRNYKSGITKDGVLLYVYKGVISNKPFDSYDGINMIFHKNTYLCSDSTCKNKIYVKRGSVLQKENEGNNSFAIKLSRFAKNTKSESVYINTDENIRMQNRGHISIYDSNNPFEPYYKSISSTTIDELSTSCGTTKDEISLKSIKKELKSEVNPTGFVPFLKSWFNISVSLAAASEDKYTVKKSFGKTGIAIERREIIAEIDRGNVQNKTKYYADIVYGCYSDTIKIVIKKVTIRDEYGKIVFVNDFESLHKTKLSDNIKKSSYVYKVYNKNGHRPFLISINNHEYYEKMLDALHEDEVESSLTRVFMKEFNASCKSTRPAGEQESYRSVCSKTMKKL